MALAATISKVSSKFLAARSIHLSAYKTISLTTTRSSKDFVSEFYRRHSLETLANKKKLLCLENIPEINEVIDVDESTAEWNFVERLLPRQTVPVFSKSMKNTTFSGWNPPADTAPDLPYYVRRQRTQLLPVYLEVKSGGTRILTQVRYIEGDIWAFEKDLRKHLENLHKKTVLTQVHEVANFVRFKGDCVNDVKQWLLEKEF